MDIDTAGKGEARLEPVEVDVIDNLINAQAAYLEAITLALDHFDVEHREGNLPHNTVNNLLEAMQATAGIVLVAKSLERA